MNFDKIQSPQQLMQFLDNNISYGVVDKNGIVYNDSSSDDFQRVCNTEWRVQSVNQIISSGVGHCYDQVEVEREWFKSKGYQYVTVWVCAYQQGIENSGFSHSYLVYSDNDKWYLFEHADCSNKGILEFDSLQNAVKFQAENQIKYATSCIKPQDKYSLCIKVFDKPNIGLNMQQYLNFIDNSKDFQF